jgi:hypothetical protein
MSNPSHEAVTLSLEIQRGAATSLEASGASATATFDLGALKLQGFVPT